jgi:anti-sigma regulatory factor (Ser/Thr protein kinase)
MRPPPPSTLALRTISVTYPGGAEHVRAVRADLRRLLQDCPMADMILCASELAANAAIHSNSRLPGGTFTVRATISPGQYARIEVEDNGAPWTQPQVIPPGTTDSTSSAPSRPSGASTATTPPAPSGQDSTGPNTHNQTCIRRAPALDERR